MRSRKLLLTAAAVVATVAAACGSSAAGAPSSHTGGHSSSGDSTSGGATGAGSAGTPADSGSGGAPVPPLPALTAAQLAGQRVVYSYSGTTPPPALLTLIRHGEAAGVIFFSGNIPSEAQVAAQIRKLDQANAAATNPLRNYPLLLMTDQEGGLVRRLPGRPALSEKQVGQAKHPLSAATTAGQGAAANLRGVGMNVNLAPVLDVYRVAGNFIDQYGRSYSNDLAVVSRLGASFIRAQQGRGVAATAKHFPGLGAAARGQNTDLQPVTLNLAAAAIRSVDEYPYRAAIAAGVKLVMMSWAVYPALDATHPAGLSASIVQNELRQRLGFTGVTITDALEAGALRPVGAIASRAVLAARAGMDLLLCAEGKVAEGQHALTALQNAYNHGTLGSAGFKAAVQRILALRASLPA